MLFSLRNEPEQRLNLSGFTPDRLAGLSRKEIETLAIGTTKIRVSVGDVFRVTKGDPASICIVGGSRRLDRIGEAMTGGSILVEGDAGARVAREMQGGNISIRGSVGPWAGSGMSGGSLKIRGNAGDWLGGPLPGELAGMRGGTVLVQGEAGTEAGHRMRRGTIVIAKAAASFAGRSMIAGTLVVCGSAGQYPGVMMRRGTLVLGGSNSRFLPTFLDCGPVELAFSQVLGLSLAGWAPAAARILGRPLRRLAGDHAVGGKGEILTPL